MRMKFRHVELSISAVFDDCRDGVRADRAQTQSIAAASVKRRNQSVQEQEGEERRGGRTDGTDGTGHGIRDFGRLSASVRLIVCLSVCLAGGAEHFLRAIIHTRREGAMPFRDAGA